MFVSSTQQASIRLPKKTIPPIELRTTLHCCPFGFFWWWDSEDTSHPFVQRRHTRIHQQTHVLGRHDAKGSREKQETPQKQGIKWTLDSFCYVYLVKQTGKKQEPHTETRHSPSEYSFSPHTRRTRDGGFFAFFGKGAGFCYFFGFQGPKTSLRSLGWNHRTVRGCGLTCRRSWEG